MENSITISVLVNAPIHKVWDKWTKPEHIVRWTFASDDWHAPFAESDLKVGGKFSTTMAAKDGSFSFDFSGVFTDVHAPTRLAYTMDDGRMALVEFQTVGAATKVTESFQMEGENSEEMQRSGWQAILDNFKKYVESL